MTARLLNAAAFAAEKHRHQRRKDADRSPYINHPLAVAACLAVEGGVTDETILVAALLHDTIEDTATTPDELREAFGADVCRLVEEVSDDKTLAKAVRKQLQIEHAPQLSPEAKQLKIADKICNIRDLAQNPPADWEPGRITEYLDWAQRVVNGCRGANAELDRLFDATLAKVRQGISRKKGD